MSILTQTTTPGTSTLERLPSELLRKILIFVALNPTPATTYQDPNTKPTKQATSLPCLLTSRTLHATALPVMYRDITTSLPSTFTAFLSQIRCNPSLGILIRSLDLSPLYTSPLYPRPENEVLVNPLPGLLSLTPLLRSFRLTPSLQDHLTLPVLRQIFTELPYLETVDLSGCNSPQLVWEFKRLVSEPGFEVSKSIAELRLNDCVDLPSEVFEVLLPQMPRLRVLEARRTQVTVSTLEKIPGSARLVELDLSYCEALDGREMAGFLKSHPAVRGSLEIMNLDASEESPFLAEEDITSILSTASPHLKVLTLKNSFMTAVHVPLLRTLVGRIEELTVGQGLRMQDLEAIFLPPQETDVPDILPNEEEPVPTDSKHQTILDPMEEAVAICKLRCRINSIASSTTGETSRLRVLDLSGMSTAEQGKIRMSVLLGPQSGVLERIKISEKVLRRVGILGRVCRAVGWDVESTGRMCWIVRKLVG